MNVPKLTKVPWFPYVLFLLGFLITIWLAYKASTTKPLSGSQSVVLVLLAGIFQIGGGNMLYRVGRADPGLARAAVRKLYRLAARAKDSRQVAEGAFDGSGSLSEHDALGRLSTDMSWLEEGILESVDDWTEFHANALKGLRKDPNE